MLMVRLQHPDSVEVVYQCIFTSLGNVKTISGQFRRADLCAEHRLNVSEYRDRNSYVADKLGHSPVIYVKLIPGSQILCPPFLCEKKSLLYVGNLLAYR